MGNHLDRIDWERIYPKEPECVKCAIEEALNNLGTSSSIVWRGVSGTRRKVKWKKTILLVAMLSFVFGVTAFAATSLWKQRMEEMTREELQDHYGEVHASSIFRYNRNLSEKELERMADLRKEYLDQGHFPMGELSFVTLEEYDGHGIGFDIEKGVFCLPKDDLSDEEILEIIDYQEKVDYSLMEINKQITEGTLEQEDLMSESSVQQEIYSMADFASYNEDFYYRIVKIRSAEQNMLFSANTHATYLGSKDSIMKYLHGDEVGASLYKAEEGERIFSLYADQAGNVYVSLAGDADMSGQMKRLIRMDEYGSVECEYELNKVTTKEGEKLCQYLPYKMTTAEDGTLFLKFRGFSEEGVLAYVFDTQGCFIGKIESVDQAVSDWGAMCVGKDGYLYMLGRDQETIMPVLLKIDTDSLHIVDAITLSGTDVTVFFDDMLQIHDSEFLLIGYDGVCIANTNTGSLQSLIHGYDEKWFDEGSKFVCIDEKNLEILKRDIVDKKDSREEAELIYLQFR